MKRKRATRSDSELLLETSCQITPEQHAFAGQEAQRIMQEIEQGTSLFLSVS
ncbi:hypothetical protein EV586_101326 [Tumebacillus sp. BK434]|uniref:hypothetical protein n=1 Tax=Tumebacillus sp. BK434 TaxID=2512169 RepID=UPI0010E62332|nr:hypothetical protein [Tumebacillus sp. BK434]TCP59110.1 hypothetical protein EV586_101326 [Tumebacillus sp. BK434]